jgi:hypothetical protein
MPDLSETVMELVVTLGPRYEYSMDRKITMSAHLPCESPDKLDLEMVRVMVKHMAEKITEYAQTSMDWRTDEEKEADHLKDEEAEARAEE